jgi:hypothetical protein
MVDPDYFSVVFLKQCPYCGDKLKIIDTIKSITEYGHNDAGRTWCYQTNFFWGDFWIDRNNLGVLYEGKPGGYR